MFDKIVSFAKTELKRLIANVLGHLRNKQKPVLHLYESNIEFNSRIPISRPTSAIVFLYPCSPQSYQKSLGMVMMMEMGN